MLLFMKYILIAMRKVLLGVVVLTFKLLINDL
jgi:hypothetical protein